MTEESTTPDLVEQLRQLNDAVSRRDLDCVVGFFAPEAVWEQAGGATLEGAAEVRRFAEDMWSSFEDSGREIADVVDFGNGVGLSVVDHKGRPHGSSYEVEMRLANVSVWEDGEIVRITHYTDIDEARAVAERLAEERG